MASSSSATDASDCFYTAKVEESASLTDEVTQTVGAEGASTAGRSEYYSARCEAMMQSRGTFSDEVEFEIEHSKPHWSEVTRLAPLSEEEEQQNEENRKVFAELRSDPECGHFFWTNEFQMGRKIAQGGQAEIFEVLDHPDYLLKVFPRGSLVQLRQLWPLQVLKKDHCVTHCVFGGTMLEDGRFAFLMTRCWGDLRKLIDMAMEEKNRHGVQGPPFPYNWDGMIMYAEHMVWESARRMERLHEDGISHRDLKASNILLLVNSSYPPYRTFEHWVFSELHNFETPRLRNLVIADFECSIGVEGTGFWRAPEILKAKEEKKAILFTQQEWEKADVYSFGMVCFEIVTGRLPFAGELENTKAGRTLVINGQRPKLPSDMNVVVKNLITKCWDSNPRLRPTFSEVCRLVRKCKPLHFRLFRIHDELPLHYRLATRQDVQENSMELLRVMRGWQIANLDDGFVDGALYGCVISTEKCNDVGHKLARLCYGE